MIYAKDREKNTNQNGGKKDNPGKDRNLGEKFSGKKLERIKSSLKGKNNYRFLVKSTDSIDTLGSTFGSDAKIKKVGNDTYMVKLPLGNTKFRGELTKLDNGILPEKIAEYNVIEPQVFEAFSTDYLSGESLDMLWGMTRVGAPDYAEELATKTKIQVGVLDTGIDGTHTDLNGNYNTGLSYDFIGESSGSIDDNGHGTQVAGVIGARINSGGIFGSDPNTDLISLKVLSQDGIGTTYDVLDAIAYAKSNNIPVINVSFGGIGSPVGNPVCDAITDARNNGTLTVVSAGNSHQEVNTTIPAACPDAITVGAMDKDGNVASFSNYGNLVDVYAPGVDIYTTNLNNSYTIKNGTSFSAPLVTGLIAKELAYNGDISYENLLSNITSNYHLITNSSSIPPPDTTGSGSTQSGGSATGSAYIPPPIDYNTYHYYSGTFEHDGLIYGNSLYGDSLGFMNLNLGNVEIYTYDEYLSIANTGSGIFQALSIPTSGLIEKLDLNGSGYALVGDHGTPVNATWQATNRRGYAHESYKGNGSNSYVQLPYGTINGLSAGSISVWARRGNIGYQESLVDKLVPGVSNHVQLMFEGIGGVGDNKIRFRISDLDLASSGAITDTDWHHIVGTWSSSSGMQLYIDGALNASNSTNTQVPGNTNPVYIGAVQGASTAYYSGNIELVRIYNRVISSSEVTDLFGEAPPPVSNDTSSSTIISPSNQLVTNPTANYDFRDKNIKMVMSNAQELLNNIIVSAKAIDDAGDPVVLSKGEFTYDNTLMSIPGKGMPFEFKVSYKNQLYYNGPVGINWDHNYNMYLTGETNGNILYYNGQLGIFRFTKSGSVFDYNPGLQARLTETGGLYTMTYDNGDIYSFNSGSKLSRIEDANSNSLNFTYSGGLLSTVTDTLGRDMSYIYYDHNRLKEVIDPTGQKVSINYFTGGAGTGSIYDVQSMSLTHGTGATKTISFEYSTGGTDTTDHAITKLIDAKGQVYVENTYDTGSRVSTQKYGSGTLTYTYTLSGTNITKNTVLDKLGNKTEYSYDTNGNQIEIEYYNIAQTGSVTYTYEYDSLGYMIAETKPRGNGFTYTYDGTGNLIEKRMKTDMSAGDSSSDLVTTSTYDSSNRILSETSASGVVTLYTRDSAGNILTKTLPDITTTTGVTLTGTTTYTYLSGGLLSTITTADGNKTAFLYSSGQVSAIIRGTGSLTSTGTMSYDYYGNMLSLTDGEGKTKTLEYTPWNLLSTGATDLGSITTYAYDANNNKTRETKYFSGGTAVNSYFYYDILDRMTESLIDTDAGKTLLTTYKYDENDNIIEKKVGSGALYKYTYNEFSKVVEERIIMVPGDSSKDIVTTYTYDDNGNLTSQIDPLGNTTTYTYSLYDRLTRTTLPDGTTYDTTYNRDSTVDSRSVSSSTGVLMSKTHTAYDGYGHTVREVQYLDLTTGTGTLSTSYFWTPGGLQYGTIDPRGNTTMTTYDTLGRVDTVTDALGNRTSYTYDKRDLVITKTLTPSGGSSPVTTTYEYDDDGRLVNEEDELSQDTVYEYNALGHLTHVTDPNSHARNFTYDYLGRKTSESETLSGTTITTSYAYDDRGNLLTVTDPEGHTTSYAYDGIGRNTTVTYADSSTLTNTYDKASHLTSRTDANGTVMSNTYNSVDRLTARAITRGTGVLGVTGESYIYDPLGRLVSGGDSLSGALTFSYDALSRLVSESQFISGSTTKTVGYTYDSGSNLTKIVYPDSRQEVFAYDALARPTAITYSGGTIATYSYTGVTMTDIAYGNGTSTAFSYDALLRLDTLTTPGANLEYTYSPGGDITSDGQKSYEYDSLRRLTSVTPTLTGGIAESYVYDKTGNRVTTAKGITPLSPTSTNYTTNNLDQYTETTGGENKVYSYDNNGNLTNDGVHKFAYDYQNRLVEVRNFNTNSVIARHTYDLLGRRTQKIDTSRSSTASETTLYTYANENTVTEEKKIQSGTSSLVLHKTLINGLATDSLLAYDTDERSISEYNLGKLSFCDNRVFPYSDEFTSYSYTGIINDCNNIIFSSSGATTTNRYYIHTNHQGSVVSLTDSSGTTVVRYEYDSFGNAYVVTGSSSGSISVVALASYTGSLHENTRLFTGREYDKETRLYFLRARYYSPSTGRFISRDPIGQNDQINLYTYVANSPMMYVDLMGREKQLLEDIKNGNTFTVSLVGRNLQKFPTIAGTHTFIMIESTNKNGQIKTYSIGGQSVKGKLTGIFNNPDDVVHWNGVYGGGSVKSTMEISTPADLNSGQFVQNIYDTFKDYNENRKVDFNVLSKPFWSDSSGNCSNLLSTILYKASNSNEDTIKQIGSFENLGFDWGIGETLY